MLKLCFSVLMCLQCCNILFRACQNRRTQADNAYGSSDIDGTIFRLFMVKGRSGEWAGGDGAQAGRRKSKIQLK